MNRLIKAVALFALTGCDQLTSGETTPPSAESQPSEEDKFKQQMEKAIRYALKDPDSAQFRNVFAYPKYNIGCGEVNAKNGFGGYTGFDHFVLNGAKVTMLSNDPLSFKSENNKCLAAAFRMEVELYESEKRDLLSSSDMTEAKQARIKKLDSKIAKTQKRLSYL